MSLSWIVQIKSTAKKCKVDCIYSYDNQIDNFYCFQIQMQGHNHSNVAFLKKYYGQNIENLMKIRQKRLTNGKNIFHSSQTSRRFKRPSSQTKFFKQKTPLRSPKPKQPQKKMFKKLSNQLKVIQESINSLVQRRTKKQAKYRSKIITQPAQVIQDPKRRIYNQVLNQIQQIKKSRNSAINIKVQPKKPILNTNQLRTLFYGVDFIDGIQFKIKIQLSQQIYCLMAKNSHTKLLLEMSAKDYVDLQNQKLDTQLLRTTNSNLKQTATFKSRNQLKATQIIIETDYQFFLITTISLFKLLRVLLQFIILFQQVKDDMNIVYFSIPNHSIAWGKVETMKVMYPRPTHQQISVDTVFDGTKETFFSYKGYESLCIYFQESQQV